MQPLHILGPESHAGAAPTSAAAPLFFELPETLARTAATIESLYVHIPFCTTKCDYCDFYSLPGKLDRVPEYLSALEREMLLHARFFGRPAPKTIFIGGGTPTLLSPAQLSRLIAALQTHADFSRLEEFTVEANPNTFDAERAAALVSAGVNRISFGAQSFVPAELKTLQRDHDPASVSAAFQTARRAGIQNLNLDLIFGIPGQTLDSWAFSLDQALGLSPSHISCYSLTYESGTGMTARLRRGEIQQIDEDLELQMFDHVYHRLRDAGFIRYETSNYARAPDGQSPQICRHNLAYWKAANWLGFGTSAGSHIALPHLPTTTAIAPVAWQWKNAGSLAHYLGALVPKSPRIPVSQLEALPQKKWSAAATVFWLRLGEGLNFSEFQNRTGVDVREPLSRVLSPFAQMGLAEITDSTALITEKGVPVSDHILARVLVALEM